MFIIPKDLFHNVVARRWLFLGEHLVIEQLRCVLSNYFGESTCTVGCVENQLGPVQDRHPASAVPNLVLIR